jgi:hypothetical protein
MELYQRKRRSRSKPSRTDVGVPVRKISLLRHDTQELVYELEVPDAAIDDVVIPWYAHGSGKGIEPGVSYDYVTEWTEDPPRSAERRAS